MTITSLIISIISCLIALGGIIFSIYKFSSYDKKNATYDAIIKEYQVRNLQKEEESSKKAKIAANLISSKSGSLKVRFYNNGKAIAKNINFETIDDIKLQVYGVEELLPYPLLNPLESFNVTLGYWGDEAVCKIKITWEDNSGVQEYIQALQLY